jgi:hypothetical protein
MERTGTLRILNGNSRLDRLLLARRDEPDPLRAATAFLGTAGFDSGDRIRVTGADGQIGNVDVMFITNAARDDQ